jgi:hypothetical protein
MTSPEEKHPALRSHPLLRKRKNTRLCGATLFCERGQGIGAVKNDTVKSQNETTSVGYAEKRNAAGKQALDAH